MKIAAEAVKRLRDRTGVSMGKCKEALEQVGGDEEKAIDFLRKAGVASAVKKAGREANEGIIGFAEGKEGIAIIEVNSETDFVAQNETFKKFVASLCEEASNKGFASVEELMNSPSPEAGLTFDQYRGSLTQSLGENIQVKRITILPKASDLSVGLYSHMGGKIVTAVVLHGASGHEALAKDIAMHTAAEAPEYLKPEEVPADVKAREEEIARAQVAGKPENIVEKIVEGKLSAFYDQACLIRQKFVKDNSQTVTAVVEAEAKKAGKPLSVQSFVRWKVGE